MEKECVTCQDCKTELTDINKVCPNCNSNKKLITLELFEEIELKLYDSISGKKINPKLSSKKKVIEKFFDGHSQSANGDWAYKKQIISSEKDYYYEEVKSSSGETIRFCEEPLSEHKNRGSAKFKNK